MNDALENLLQNPRVWRGSQRLGIPSPGHETACPTGYARLDIHLPGGGWPRHALTEILLEHYGTGELKLLMPALSRLSHADKVHSFVPATGEQAGWIAWIAPPFQPYPPALLQWGINLEHMLMVHPRQDVEALWAAEQALSSGNCAAVLVWSNVMDSKASRRLQLAAEKGRALGFAFRPSEAAAQPSAAALRLALSTGERGTDVRIVKSRGGRPVTVSGVMDGFIRESMHDHAV